MVAGIISNTLLTQKDTDASQSKLRKICAEFESIFVNYMLRSMRKSVGEAGMLGKTHESKMYRSMFDETLAAEISRGGGIGLGNMLFERLKNQSTRSAPSNDQTTEAISVDQAVTGI